LSRSALTAGLRYLRGIVASQQYREDNDEQLLHAFAFQHDDSAFAVLVRRHGPMVLHVCRRVLGQEQDAEDAFQATFLVFARSAAKLRKKAALASFLHGTAYRLALSARRAAARRRKHEGQTPVRSSVDPADDISWREVRALLDEEIARLPEKYRSVFILCCLEELSRAEAAQRLGLKESTVSGRLEVARQRLQRRLSRRGVELTAVLTAATLAAQPTSALPPVLVSSTLKAALREEMAGLVSAPVAELVKSAASKSIRSKIAALLALAAGVVAVGAVSRAALRHEPPMPGSDPPHAEAPQSAAQKPTDAMTVRGRVLGPDGKPVRGARLYWPRALKNEPRSSEDVESIDIAERAKSDADGRFRFELPRSDIHAGWLKNVSLIAVADGYGVDGVELPREEPAPEVTLRLVKDQPIEGRVISTEGKPVAGVNVRIMGVGKTRQERLDDFLHRLEAKKSPRRQCGHQQFVSADVSAAEREILPSGDGQERPLPSPRGRR
jgi:RNA polymerase sigma factor (sigma-70 family)